MRAREVKVLCPCKKDQLSVNSCFRIFSTFFFISHFNAIDIYFI